MLLPNRSRRSLLPIAYLARPVVMVSDGIVKIVFLSLPVPGVFFPLRKGNSSIFFTVKQLFLKIKLWPEGTGHPRGEREISI